MPLSREIMERVDRVADFHRATRLTRAAAAAGAPFSTAAPPRSAHAYKPPPPPAPPPRFNIFENAPKIALPTNILDLPDSTLSILQHGHEALPDSQRLLPQEIRTLSTWLFMASGMTTHKLYDDRLVPWLTYPSAGGTYPNEIYVAAFSIDGLEPGFYHYHPKEFCLRKLRDGWETLAHLIRGRPDLNFLKTVPAVLLVSTVYNRASARFGKRGYCTALLDTGHLIENLVQTATALGIDTLVRQAINDNTMRELIGLPLDTPFAEAESVQAMIAWADKTSMPLPLLARRPPTEAVAPYGSIQAVHFDCVAPGMAVREVRPPLTEMVVLAADYPAENFPDPEPINESEPMRQTLLEHPPTDWFGTAPMGRAQLWTINQLSFRKGAYWPLLPDGTYPAFVRPFWIVHDITGLDSGVWHYNVKTHRWHSLRAVAPDRVDRLRGATQQMCLDNLRFAYAAAVCVLTVHWQQLLTIGGPDLYRLAHLEAGIVSQRIALATSSMGFAYATAPQFYPDVARRLLSLEKTSWEPIYCIAIGGPSKGRQ